MSENTEQRDQYELDWFDQILEKYFEPVWWTVLIVGTIGSIIVLHRNGFF